MSDNIHICPKCGSLEFFVTAHVTQDWRVDTGGNFIECTDQCSQVVAQPNNADLWTCAHCGYDTEGSEFYKTVAKTANVPFCVFNLNEAVAKNELKAYSTSLLSNALCEKAIQTAVAHCQTEDGLSDNIQPYLQTLNDIFSATRVKSILAATIRDRSWSPLISLANKDWAKNWAKQLPNGLLDDISIVIYTLDSLDDSTVNRLVEIYHDMSHVTAVLPSDNDSNNDN